MDRRYLKQETRDIANHRMLYDMMAALPVQTFELVNLLDTPPGLCLEFGVASGASTCVLHRILQRDIYGFDSFEGLPEDWGKALQRGAFAGIIPRTEDGIHIIKGWIEHTLPSFLASHDGPVAFANIDVDIYSTTKFVLEKLDSRFVPGSIVLVDDLTDFAPCLDHQCKAWFEFISETQQLWEIVCRYSKNSVMFRKTTGT